MNSLQGGLRKVTILVVLSSVRLVEGTASTVVHFARVRFDVVVGCLYRLGATELGFLRLVWVQVQDMVQSAHHSQLHQRG